MSRHRRLDPDLDALYQQDQRLLNQVIGAAASSGDLQTVRAAEDELRNLQHEYAHLQAARGPQPPTALERENTLTLAQRIDRIEQHLGLGRYHKDFDHG